FGVIALIFGLTFLLVPDITLTLFLIVFGAFMILTGIVLLGFSRDRTSGRNWRNLNRIEGVIAIIIGIVAILAPGFTSLLAVYLVAFFAIISGLLQIGEGVVAARGRTTLGQSNRWLLVISGAFSLLVGILLAVFPSSGLIALMWLIGIFLIVVGVLNIVSGMRLRTQINEMVTKERVP
ncbi:MAG: DUF308 domain-containing protein, partial [Methanomassiliicoccus sp.]|nr:DUF308 domain-containing protein [Methanomassiliicoccus sp.]